eukprot:GHVH01004464.1.p1 GENE.GHVH01004464.1~~GHVH01004464.1.p1  ORF type:complete len:645 (+),score=71.57 GHVH01004464.1:23-1957(+)
MLSSPQRTFGQPLAALRKVLLNQKLHNCKNEDVVLLKKIMPYLWPKDPKDRLMITANTALMFAGKFATIRSPKLMADEIEKLGHISMSDIEAASGKFDPMKSHVYKSAMMSYVYKIFAMACNESRHVLFAPVIRKSSIDLASKTFDAIHGLPLLELQEMHLGQICSIQSRGIKSVSNLMNAVLFRGFPCLVEFGMILKVLIGTIGRDAALISAATVYAFTKFTFDMSAHRVKQRRIMNQRENEENSEFIDSLTNAEPIRLFGAESIRSSKYVKLAERFELAQKDVFTSLAVLNFLQGFIFNLGVYLCQILAINHILGQRSTISDLILATNLLQQLSVPLNFTGNIYRDAKNAMLDLKALDRLTSGTLFLDSTTTPHNNLCEEEVDALLAIPQPIVFENVSFAYTSRGGGSTIKGPIVLNNVSLEIDAKEFCAIVGRSGSGKSTMLKLVYRLMKPDSGRILLGSTPIDEIPIQRWRQYLGIVPQDIPLFNDTIRNNVTMGDDSISDERVEEAVAVSSLSQLMVKLPHGLDTETGERGLALSGGERQRIALSRCLVRDPKVVIFDEATSSLDVQTEREIMDCATSERLSDVTRLVVAHRLSSIKNADRIVVMGDGSILEQGNHAKLLEKKSGIYSTLWNEQIKGIF